MQKIVTNLWFDTQAEEAAQFYIAVFGSGRILNVAHHRDDQGEPGTVLSVDFEVAGQRFIGINGGPQFQFTEAISLGIACEDQAEVDRFWFALLADGGEESQCGWLKDKYGLSWQVTPSVLLELTADSDPARAARAIAAMMGMKRLIIADLVAAADGTN